MPLSIIQGDITKVRADALVNAANSRLSEGGGVCGAIFSGAGREEMRKACQAIGGCETGRAVITPAFGLPAKYVIHAVGPVYAGGGQGEAGLLRSAYGSALRLAREHGLRSVAFPLISAGVYGYPRREAMDVATEAIRDFLTADEGEMEVTLVLYDREDLRLDEGLRKEIDGLIRRAEYSRAREMTRRLERSRNRRYLEEEEALDASMPLDSAEGAFRIRESDLAREMAPRPAAAPYAAPSSLESLIGRLDESFAETLLRLIDRKGLKDSDVYKRANLTRQHFHKIRSIKGYAPSKATVLALAVALELNEEEAGDLLARAGYAFSPSLKFDTIVRYFIRKRKFDIFAINEALFCYDQQLLGA